MRSRAMSDSPNAKNFQHLGFCFAQYSGQHARLREHPRLGPGHEQRARAIIDVVDIMTCYGQEYPTSFIEGYLINPDGTTGPRFVDLGTGDNGVIPYTQIGPSSWTYEKKLEAYMITTYLTNATDKTIDTATSKITGIKELVLDNGQSQDTVTETMHLFWTDAQGVSNQKEFVYMQGTHVKEE